MSRRKHFNPMAKMLSEIYNVSYQEAAKAYNKCNGDVAAAKSYINLMLIHKS